MFAKLKLKRRINKYRKLVAMLEQKRVRSQAALVEAILTHTTPSDEDVDYFNRYTEKIDNARSEMQALQKQLDALK